MGGTTWPIPLSEFTFGAPPRKLLVALILEGLTLLGYLQFTSEGFLAPVFVSRLSQLVVVLGMISLPLAFIFAYQISKKSYSPLLQSDWVPFIISVGYLIFGWLATGVGFLLHSLITQQLDFPSEPGLIFGISLGSLYGFLILFYLDRYEVQTPSNRQRLESLVGSLVSCREGLESSKKAPIRLTGSYENLVEILRDISDVLGESSTPQGKALAHDIDRWIVVYEDKPEISQASIVDRTRTPKQKDLTELQQEFESIRTRLVRISRNE